MATPLAENLGDINRRMKEIAAEEARTLADDAHKHEFAWDAEKAKRLCATCGAEEVPEPWLHGDFR